jgi:hypothetical protein
MMDGRGVTNYDIEKPSFAFSTTTTVFDDELIRRGIVTLEAAMMAKGSSAEEAQRLANMKRYGNVQQDQQEKTVARDIAADVIDANDNDGDSSEPDSEEDEFLAEYRKNRLRELKSEQREPFFGEVIPISRSDWTREVNDGSRRTWVVVTLTSSNIERTGKVEAAVADLAMKFNRVKFVAIPSHSAIPNWPDENLPTLFCYRNCKMQHQLVQLSCHLSKEQLERKLAELGVLETYVEEEPMTARIKQHNSNVSDRGVLSRYLVDEDDFDGVD